MKSITSKNICSRISFILHLCLRRHQSGSARFAPTYVAKHISVDGVQQLLRLVGNRGETPECIYLYIKSCVNRRHSELVKLYRENTTGWYFIITMLVVLASLTIGFLVATRKRNQLKGKGEGVVGSAVAAMLGLLAFILAFTFGTTASRFDTRKQLLLNEVNALGTAVLRTDFLPETHRTQCRELLIEYVNIRANPNAKAKDLPCLIAESDKILDKLWAETNALGCVNK